jgi:hypothetical protein
VEEPKLVLFEVLGNGRTSPEVRRSVLLRSAPDDCVVRPVDLQPAAHFRASGLPEATEWEPALLGFGQSSNRFQCRWRDAGCTPAPVDDIQEGQVVGFRSARDARTRISST